MKLKKISQTELDEILNQHKKWASSNNNIGSQADLSYIDLSGIDLQYANLYGADLSGANLHSADLGDANLQHADLQGTNLQHADLGDADLRNIDLRGANLYGADLSGANLSGSSLQNADLEEANLYGANLQSANLHGADLGDADLRNTDLHGSNLEGADLGDANLRNSDLRCANLQYADLWDTNLKNAKIDITTKGINDVCPKIGSFVGYKKAYSIDGWELLVTLDIPEDAERSSATGKKCRCNKAKVLSITNINIGESQQVAYGVYDDSFKYQVGKTVEPDKWDPHFWKECTHGIHFFMDEQDALDY